MPELDDHPRIIVAAGNFGGLEITSTALWLRSFGIDLKLVELAPYLVADGSIILVPRVLIPLPEAAEYIVGHEKKEEVQRRAAAKSKGIDYRPFLESIVEEFATIPIANQDWFSDSSRSEGRNYVGFAPHAFGLRHSDVHFEWTLDAKGFTVGLHFERPIGAGGRVWNPRMADRIEEAVGEGSSRKLERLARGKTLHWVGYTLSSDIDSVDMSAAGVRSAAEAMAQLLRETSGPLQSVLEDETVEPSSIG